MGQKAKDLTGQKFGELTAIKIVDSTPSGKIWECLCSCGNKTNVLSARLISGKTRSCGHLKHASKALDEAIGKKFGRLTVVGKGTKDGYCICKCDCGNIKEIYLQNVKNGKTQSCGCLHKERVKETFEIDLTGQRFGRWLVIGKSEKNGFCKCLCDCGTIRDVSKGSLKNGVSTSCGCYKKELTSEIFTKNIVGQKFGKLTVIDRNGSYTDKNGLKYATWNCICDCGNHTIVKGCDLQSGKVSSCGCLISKGEFLMRQELIKRNVLFSTQYGFNDLRSDKNYPLRFDFAILNNNKELQCLIEYQGIQHDKIYEKYHNSFGQQQRNVTDVIKKEYCKAHNILLYEIWYNQDIGKELDKILQSINYTPILCQTSNEEGATTIRKE